MQLRRFSTANAKLAQPAWREPPAAAKFSGMGGLSRANQRSHTHSFAWAWLAGAIVLVPAIAPACTSETASARDQSVADGGTGGNAGTTSDPPDNTLAGAGNPPSEPTAPPVCAGGRVFEGTYTVPVSPELADYASYPVSDIEFCERDGTTTLSYELPALLVGGGDKLSFRGTFAANQTGVELSGEQGSASCSADGESWTCNEVLTDVTVREDKLAQELAMLPADEAQGRSAVSDVFSQDPIGVLTFTTP